MARIRTMIGLLVTCLLWVGTTPTALAAARAVLPLAGPVVRGFDPPNQPWLPGHRGVDILGAPGAEVVAAMAGQVVFAGAVAGRDVVVVSHGELRTTYLPVRPLVHVGGTIAAGEVIGLLQDDHPCPGGGCLHWGLKRGEDYLDPLSLLDQAEVRLLPRNAAAQIEAVHRYRDAALGGDARAGGLLSRPVPGAIGSRFGMRMHPILRINRMHSGVDIGAPCAYPIRAAAPGRVARVSFDSQSGHRLELHHGNLGGHQLTTIYLHAISYSVSVGQHVERGQVVGKVGSTGLSTGCHLHFTVKVDGRLVDPQRFL